jgi:hypothetical protein
MYCTNCGKELENGEICSCQENNQQLNEMPKKKGGWKVVLTAIIYPLIVTALNFLIPSFWLYNVISVLFAIGFATFMVLGGFYLIIIPLPVVYLFQYGCCKPELPTLKKVLYVIAAIVCIALALVFTFIGL